MTRTTPELTPPSPNFHATPTGGRLTTTFLCTCITFSFPDGTEEKG
ncbi:hypothetical protein AVEN_77097-1, partial [Araneus ventricosus]